MHTSGLSSVQKPKFDLLKKHKMQVSEMRLLDFRTTIGEIVESEESWALPQTFNPELKV